MRSENTFQQTAAQASGSIMTLGCITLAIPAAYHMSVKSSAALSGNTAQLALLNTPRHRFGDASVSSLSPVVPPLSSLASTSSTSSSS